MKEFRKQHGKVVCFGIALLLGILIGGESILAYLQEHTYYSDIIHDSTNWWLFIIALILAVVPVGYLATAQKFSLKTMVMIFAGISGIFGVFHSAIKAEIIGIGWIICFFNTVLLFFLGAYALLGMYSIGTFIERKLIHFQQRRRQEILLSLGIGLCAFLLLINVLLQTNLLYGWVTVALFIGLGACIYAMRGVLFDDEKVLNKEMVSIATAPKAFQISLYCLIGIVFVYLLFGFQNSFIPYSTAWDANHEYMYIPKILSENAGVLWNNTVGGGFPGLRHGFIAFFFSLAGGKGLPWHQIFGLNPNTIAVSTNFRSAILVFIFGIGMISEIFEFIRGKKQEKEEKSEIKSRVCPVCKKTNKEKFCSKCGEPYPAKTRKIDGFGGVVAGWGTLLLWLTSGMGAFLVMVDNKTDLGVMAISSLALFSGILFLEYTQKENEVEEEQHVERKEYLKYLIIAGLLFGCGCLAKVTAFVDLALFGVLFVGLRISNISALGLGFTLAGIVRYLNILTSSFIIEENLAKVFIVIGVLLILGGIVNTILQHKKIGKAVFQGIVLLVSFFIPFLLFKTPAVLYQLNARESLSLQTFKQYMLAKTDFDSTHALADTDSEDLTQNPIVKAPQEARKCLEQGNIYSEEELAENLEKDKGQGLNEDVGRYIGYGWKEFSSENNILFPFIKIPFLKFGCYGFNEVAVQLCENSDAVDNFDIVALKKIYEDLKNAETSGGVLLKGAIDAFDEKYSSSTASYNPQEFRDHIVSLRQYYQSHSIKSDDDYLAVPYRFIVPFNISMNRSLQNLSSYYTDIGFVWIILYVLMVSALIYALIHKEKKLLSISLANLIGWGIRWIIGGGILWYGTVLISRTILTITTFFSSLQMQKLSVASKNLLHLMILLCCLAACYQLFLNFMRIASQGASGPFVWYKENVGKDSEYVLDSVSRQITVAQKKKYNYGEKDIFDLQFPQYNALISYLKDRKDEDGVKVAGTYIQYFLHNQKNLQLDGMLTDFAEKISDGDLCKSYWRLKNQNLKYLIIDPNIGSVGMGEGNESLFQRFFAKLSAVDGKIEKDGILSALVRFYQQGYLKLISTNHIGFYYALTLDDETLKKYLGNLTAEEMVLRRAKFMGIRYFSNEIETIFTQIYRIFFNRLISFEAVPEMLMMSGVEGDVDAIRGKIINYYQGNGKLDIDGLSKGEISTMIQYINLYNMYQQGSNSLGENIQQMILNSISSSSQILGVELV